MKIRLALSLFSRVSAELTVSVAVDRGLTRFPIFPHFLSFLIALSLADPNIKEQCGCGESFVS